MTLSKQLHTGSVHSACDLALEKLAPGEAITAMSAAIASYCGSHAGREAQLMLEEAESYIREIEKMSKIKDIVCKRVGHNAVVNIGQMIIRHSPTGFEWGYGGSGPSDLALNIVDYGLLALGHEDPDLRDRIYQEFKREFIAPMPREGGILAGEVIELWLRNKISEEVERLR